MSDAEGYTALGDAEAEAARTGKRNTWVQRVRWPLIIAGPIAILAVTAYFILTAGRFQSTDNAYVQIAKAPVSASIGGRVISVLVKENDVVHAGQPLFRLDARDLSASVAQQQANLSQAQLQINALRAVYEQQQASVGVAQETVATAQEALVFATREAARQKDLVAAGVASRQQADQAAHAADQAAHALDQARQQAVVARQQAAVALANLGPAQNPTVLAAQARLEQARLNQSYTEVVAPADGIVTRVEQLQPGAFVNPSQTVFWLLTGTPWVEANFKENQLENMRVGQPVEIRIDAAGGEPLAGHVQSFSPGTGAVFSALPAQNATGNWVKVTQRLPVRISFDKVPPLMAGRAGLSAKVKVDVREAGTKARP